MVSVPYNAANVVVSCPKGTRFPVRMENFGWSEDEQGYVSVFEFQGNRYRSVFPAKFHVGQHCATPDLRLAHDENFMFDELGFLVEDCEAVR
ncbi:hypothetical protein [Bradyrhizobium sp. RT9a]|uniref:hypothetical protein n=1 Tax=Bradyrhizobium sp. RT9a TaxID=3156384 RepID=UPI0033989B5D